METKQLKFEQIKKAADEYEADDIVVNTAFIAGASWAKGYLHPWEVDWQKEVCNERAD